MLKTKQTGVHPPVGGWAFRMRTENGKQKKMNHEIHETHENEHVENKTDWSSKCEQKTENEQIPYQFTSPSPLPILVPKP